MNKPVIKISYVVAKVAFVLSIVLGYSLIAIACLFMSGYLFAYTNK